VAGAARDWICAPQAPVVAPACGLRL